MNIVVTPKKLAGTITVPPSKSISHRELICAALADGKSIIHNISPSEDIRATCRVLREFGAHIERAEPAADGDALSVEVTGGLKRIVGARTVDCGESGSTLRFLIPVSLLTGGEITFTGRGRLAERPLKPYLRLFEEHRISCRKGAASLPLTVQGPLTVGTYELAGNVSSQFFTGLLLALPLVHGDSLLRSTTEMESASYVGITLDVLRRHGVEAECERVGTYRIRGGQHYMPGEYRVEGDYSQAAFWFAAGAVGSNLKIQGLSQDSRQGDKAIIPLIRTLGGQIEVSGAAVTALPGRMGGGTIDVADCPDLVPPLAVLAACSRGVTQIVRAGRARLKECDRLHAMATELNRLGAMVEEKEDALIIEGQKRLQGGRVSAWKDHRVAMALAVAAQCCDEPVIIEDAGCVCKSYPRFWRDFQSLGGIIAKEGRKA